MGKITHFSGQPVLSQLLKFVNKQTVLNISMKGGYDRYTKNFDGYAHFVCLLFGVIMRFDSLREIVIGMMAESPKLHHLGISAPPKRSTFAEANNRRSSRFFEEVYLSLYKRYRGLLADSRCGGMNLHVVDSTTITLFSNILKGAGRHPKTGRKKGGIKAHSALLYGEGVPYKVMYTSAATHDHILLKELDLHDGDTLVTDRAYIEVKVKID